jgi:O-acetyl-ADP-ribose deacetylase
LSSDRHAARYVVAPGCTLVLERGDLTTAHVDAIVNAANERMLGGGGVDGAIHRAAGPALLAACEAAPLVSAGVRCPTGEARITLGFQLPAAWVIHTVGPVYRRHPDPPAALAAAHRSCLTLARQRGLQTVAFPAISCGVYGYPLAEAAKIAVATVAAQGNGLQEIRFVLFSDATMSAWSAAARAHLGEPR